MESDDIKEKSRSLIKFIAVDLLLNVLLQLVLQTALQKYFDSFLIPILIGVAVLVLIVAISWIVYTSVIRTRIKTKKEKKMIQSSRDKIQALQTDILQDFFEIQMTSCFSDWRNEVQSVANAKQASAFSTYKEMKETFDAKGVDGVSVKDFDVTALAALMRYDFRDECCLDTQTRRLISHIVKDRNSFSHISNYNDTQSIYSVEETAIDNIRDFLNYLQNSQWNYPQKEQFFRKYMGTGNNDGVIADVSQSLSSEWDSEIEQKSYVLHYLQSLQITREERISQYIGLSYNLDGHNNEKNFLKELIESNLVSSHTGMRIVGEGGFGKSWTLSEIAGYFAEEYLDNIISEEDRPIPVLIELGKLYQECNSINKKIEQLVFKDKENCVVDFLRNNRIILLLDAMDEAKAELQADLSREITSLMEVYPNITLVCSSRKSCIDKYPTSIPCYAIKTLDNDQIVEFMEKAIDEDVEKRDELLKKAKADWTEETRKEFLSSNRTPFYLSCYVDLVRETGDNNFVDTTELVEKFLSAVIEREIRKTGFNSDKQTFINFLIELCRLIDAGEDNGEKVSAVPENDAIREISNRVIVEDGQASIKSISRKLVEMQILSRDEENMLISFAHQNYKEHINRKYPVKKYKVSW